METFLFLDTNIYLHFIQFDQIKWKELLNVDNFTIVIPITVISELDKKKIDDVPRISQQAKLIIKLLEKYNSKEVIPELVKIIFIKNECNQDTFKKYSLDNTISDDRIIASILEFKEKNNGNVILIAYDFGIKLKAGSYNIDYYEPPENLQIKIENKTEKRLKELEKENILLKNKIPDLKIFFDNQKTYKNFLFENYILDETKISDKIKELKNKLPHLQVPKDNNNKGLRIEKWDFLNKDPISQYNSDLNKYFDDYEKYLKDFVEYGKVYFRSCEIKLILVNNGTIPADDIHINFHIPDGVDVLDYNKYPNKPEEPEEPTLHSSSSMFKSPFNYSDIHKYLSVPNIKPTFPNVSGLNIKKSNSFDIDTHVKRLMHQKIEYLDIFYIVFKDYKSAFSFDFSYNIVAENIPTPINGNLHIIIDK